MEDQEQALEVNEHHHLLVITTERRKQNPLDDMFGDLNQMVMAQNHSHNQHEETNNQKEAPNAQAWAEAVLLLYKGNLHCNSKGIMEPTTTY